MEEIVRSTQGVIETAPPGTAVEDVPEEEGAERRSPYEPAGGSPAEGAMGESKKEDPTTFSPGELRAPPISREEDAPVDGSNDVPLVRRAEFRPLVARVTQPAEDNITLLMDVAVPLTVELGGVEMQIREILGLGPGSIIKLEQRVGKPLDILVNGELVGRGEVVVVDEQFGVRVTELVRSPSKNV